MYVGLYFFAAFHPFPEKIWCGHVVMRKDVHNNMRLRIEALKFSARGDAEFAPNLGLIRRSVCHGPQLERGEQLGRATLCICMEKMYQFVVGHTHTHIWTDAPGVWVRLLHRRNHPRRGDGVVEYIEGGPFCTC